MKKRILCFCLILLLLGMPTAQALALTSNGNWTFIRQDTYSDVYQLRESGCGIFALVNAVGFLTGKKMDVEAVAKWAKEDGGYKPGNGGTYADTLYPHSYSKYGTQYNFTGGTRQYGGWDSNDLKNHLLSGGVAIGHVKSHYIAIIEYNSSNNQFHVLDSYPTNARGTKSANGDVWKTGDRFVSESSVENNVRKMKLTDFFLLSRNGGSTVKPMSSGAGRTVPDGDYIIANAENPNLYMDIAGSAASAEALTTVQLAENDNPPNYDIWTVQYIDQGGFYTIKQKTGSAYLDVIEPQNGDGQNVQVWERVEYDDEIWSISRGDNGTVRFQSKANGLYATIDGDIVGGTNIVVKNPTGDSRQEWVLIPWPKTIPSGAGQTIADGNYMISCAPNLQYYLDIEGSEVPATPFTNVHLWYNEGDGDIEAHDIWTIRYVGEGGFYVIKQLNGESYLDVLTPSNAQCQNVQIWDNFNSDYDEKWSIIPNGSSYRIQSKASGMYLTVDGSIEAEININVQTSNSSGNQNWIFTPWPRTNTVSYNANGGSGQPSNQVKKYGEALTLSSTKPTRANTSADSYTITLNANGGSVSPASLSAARTTSYSFKNWNTAANGGGTSYNAGESYSANANLTLYAQWNSNTTTAEVTLPTPTRSGYIFQGWSKNSSATSGVTGKYTPGENETLYATWKAAEFYLDLNGLLDGKNSSHIEGYGTADIYINGNLVGKEKTDFYTAYPSGTKYEVKIKAANGYEYNGLAFDSAPLSGTITNSSINVRPSFSKLATYQISYNANGGAGAPGAQEKTQGTNLTLSSAKPTRASTSAGSYTVTLNANGGSVSPASLSAARTTSYSFKNWNTAANGSGTSYNPGATYSTDANVTLYAQWNSSTSTAAVTLPTPTRSGFIFKGWATSSGAASGFTGSYTPSGNVTLYAVWAGPDFVLPAALTTIDAEAFAGGAFSYVKLSDKTTSIGSRAFADCPNLRYVYIPEATTGIAGDAFSGVDGLTILGRSGSYAEFFALRNGYAFDATE